DLGKLQCHLGEMALLDLVQLDFLVHVRDHAAHAHDSDDGTQKRNPHENGESQPPRRAEREVHLPALRGIVKRSRSKTSPVWYRGREQSARGWPAASQSVATPKRKLPAGAHA